MLVVLALEANNLTQVGDKIFQKPLDYGPPWPTQMLMIVALISGVAVVLEDGGPRRRGYGVICRHGNCRMVRTGSSG